MSAPYTLAFVRETPFGVLAAVHLGERQEPVPEAVLAALHPEERAVAVAARGFRQMEVAAGRLAWHHALRASSRPDAPLLTGQAGEPLPPPALSASLSHKRNLALALVGDAADGTLGIDLEGDGRERPAIAPRVLRPEELEVLAGLPEAERWPRLQRAFAIKEATYKAIHPHLQRFVSFQEAVVQVGDDGAAAVQLFSRADEPQLALEARWEAVGGQVLAMVRARRV